MTKRIRSPFALALCLAALLGQTGCGPGKPATSVPQKPYSKALTTLEDVRASTRAFIDGYMTYFRNRVAAIKNDATLSQAQKAAAIQAAKNQANAINDIYGKAVGYEQQAFVAIQAVDPANFTGSNVTQALQVAQQIIGLFADPSLSVITDTTVLTILAATRTGLQTLVGILQLQGGQ